METNKNTARISIRCSEKEKSQIKKLASNAGLKIGRYMVLKSLGLIK